MQQKNKFGLPTCIAMIVGVVIGSGIFFKSDNILAATNGNIFLGILAFCIAAISIIFGSLTIAELAARNDKAGGVISYTEEYYNSNVACAFGWFQAFLYYPTLIAVVCYIVGIYTCMLFGIEGTLDRHILIGLATTLIISAINLFSTKLAGLCQGAATIIKLIPLALIGIAGFAFGNPVDAFIVSSTELTSGSWLSALIPIVFAFDGWIVATSVTSKVKDAKRNVPLALILAPIFILVIYLVYFVGISILVGPATIVELGDAHVNVAANALLGSAGSKVLIIFVIISVAGTANGLTMGLFNLLHSLALRNMFPYSDHLKAAGKNGNPPVRCSLVSIAIILFWLAVHYITQRFHLLGNSDVSEIATTIQYILFIALYIPVLRLGFKKEIKSIWKGFVFPSLAILGSLIILCVGMLNAFFILYLALCFALLATAYLFAKRKNVQ